MKELLSICKLKQQPSFYFDEVFSTFESKSKTIYKAQNGMDINFSLKIELPRQMKHTSFSGFLSFSDEINVPLKWQ
jgi:hypothetical protein